MSERWKKRGERMIVKDILKPARAGSDLFNRLAK